MLCSDLPANSCLDRRQQRVTSKGLDEYGLMLQYAPNGDVYKRMTLKPVVPLDQTLRWCKEVVEALKFIHGKEVELYRDINPRNILLDNNLDKLLAGSQGMLKSKHGEILLDGLAREDPISCPGSRVVSQMLRQIFLRWNLQFRICNLLYNIGP